MKQPRYIFDLHLRHAPKEIYPGEWTSTEKGAGYEFWQLREFQPGDKLSRIDWKASAKTKKLYVKEFLRDTFYNIIICCDISPSMHFGRKFELMQDIAISLAYAGLRENNTCGLLLFADDLISFVPPKSHWGQYNQIIAQLEKASFHKTSHTSFKSALRFISSSLESFFCIILSDFMFDLSEISESFPAGTKVRQDLREMVAVHILEDIEYTGQSLDNGVILVQDLESGCLMELDLGNQKEYSRLMQQRLQENKETLSDLGIDSVVVKVGEENIQDKINSFFRKRIEVKL